jgi:uncharacterized repeat protein (TIGR02543 family)
MDCTALTSVNIPETVTAIGGEAFFGCSALTSITMPNGVESIGDGAFYGCGLESMILPASVQNLGEGVFRDCQSLTAVTFADGSTIGSIPAQTFDGCTALTSVNIPDTVTVIDTQAFAGCSALPTITIPANVSSIRDLAFYDCTYLETIRSEYEGNQTIGISAFDNCGLYVTTEKRAFAHPANTNFINAIKGAGYRVNYTVSFESNGGSAVSPVTEVPYNATIEKPDGPTKSGYVFGGWYKEPELINEWGFDNDTVTEDITLYAKWTRVSHSGSDSKPQVQKTITVAEISSSLFSGSQGQIIVSADTEKAFASSVEVRITEAQEDKTSFGFAAGDEVYPFDISLYVKGTNQKTRPEPGYSVTVWLPIPTGLVEVRERIAVVHKSESGALTMLDSRLEQKDGVWYIVFETTEFSPYALVVRRGESYDGTDGVPYYLAQNGNKVFIGFAANGKYVAPEGVTVSVTQNKKNFADVEGHWAAGYIDFVTEREIFVGTGSGTFSPDTGMTRAMFATVIGRLYERSYGEIEVPEIRIFADCDYEAYYGKYVAWAADNGIVYGYGDGRFSPDDPITREQMASILFRFADFLGVVPDGMDTVLRYADADRISDYATTAALYCQTTGIITGRTGGLFAPQETATRAEVAAIVQRFVEAVLD